ncbi:MAG: FAD-dependent oxidoreductase [Anaerolineae bacterium]|nr:FAD-dependent oxidoreductase [Anaerolineae bacterium]
MSEIGTVDSPLRVAIIGSGPSGFYAAEHLFKQANLVVQIDMYDRLPTPYGLVRGGVAPDHPKIKSVTKVYEKIASNPNFRFYGNVEFGKHISHDDLKAHYHAIIYAVGAQTDRRMGIPGEDLLGSHAATEFVGWYNGHPDYRDLQFDLSQKAVAVVGNGNVAMDVVRILSSTYDELRQTDIADYALEALRESQVETIYMLGRRGPAQAAFTNPELKELAELSDADVILRPEEVALDPLTQEYIAAHPDAQVDKNLKTLNQMLQTPLHGKPRQIYMRFLVSPTELIGEGQVQAIRLVRNELQVSKDGSLRPRPTDFYETLPVGLVFRSIGYMGVALPGVPFDERAGIIPNDHGRVIDPSTNQPVLGEYVVGWIKRGPSGIIGTNKPDSVETANMLLADVPNFKPIPPSQATHEAVDQLLHERQPDLVTFADWLLIDRLETESGQTVGRPRIKYSRIAEMIEALNKAKQVNVNS